MTERALPARPIPNGMICKGDQVWIAMENGVVAVFNCVTGSMQFVQVGGGCNTILAKCNGNGVFVGTAGDPAAGIAPGFCDIDCQTLVVTPRPAAGSAGGERHVADAGRPQAVDHAL